MCNRTGNIRGVVRALRCCPTKLHIEKCHIRLQKTMRRPPTKRHLDPSIHPSDLITVVEGARATDVTAHHTTAVENVASRLVSVLSDVCAMVNNDSASELLTTGTPCSKVKLNGANSLSSVPWSMCRSEEHTSE